MLTSEKTVLYRVWRHKTIEREVFGAVYIQSIDKTVLNFGGNPGVFGRSLMKPFQMKAIVQVLETLLSSKQKAIALASHSGTEEHRRLARSILDGFKAPIQTPASPPLGGAAVRVPHDSWTHPCSGKHAAILRACIAKGWPLATYLNADHPFHIAYLNILDQILAPQSFIDQAPDGCGLPALAFRLSDLAQLFEWLRKHKDSDWIWNSFLSHPKIIGGCGRLDTMIIEQTSPTTIAKEGADGLLTVVCDQPSSKFTAVIKMAHGWDPTSTALVIDEIFRLTGQPTQLSSQLPHQTVEFHPEFKRQLQAFF